MVTWMQKKRRYKKGKIKMTVTEIIKDIMIKSRPPKTMEVLANDMGYKSASGVGERLKGNNMSVKKLCEFAEALDYEVILRPKTTKELDEYSYKIKIDK